MRKEIYRSVFFTLLFVIFYLILSFIFIFLFSPLLEFFPKSYQFLLELITLLVPTLLYIIGYLCFYKHKKIDLLDDLKPPKKHDYLLKILLIYPIILLIDLIWTLLLQLFKIDIASFNSNFENGIIMILYGCILAPIMEEIVFRGLICSSLKKYNKYIAIIISSILFACFHLTIEQSLPVILVGSILAYLYIKYDSLIPSILLHILNNTISMITTNISITSPIIIEYILLGTGILITLFFIFKQRKNIPTIVKQIKIALKELFSVHLSYLFFIIYILIIIIPFFYK